MTAEDRGQRYVLLPRVWRKSVDVEAGLAIRKAVLSIQSDKPDSDREYRLAVVFVALAHPGE